MMHTHLCPKEMSEKQESPENQAMRAFAVARVSPERKVKLESMDREDLQEYQEKMEEEACRAKPAHLASRDFQVNQE